MSKDFEIVEVPVDEESTPSSPVASPKKARKPRKPMSEEHKAKARENLAKARAARKERTMAAAEKSRKVRKAGKAEVMRGREEALLNKGKQGWGPSMHYEEEEYSGSGSDDGVDDYT